MMKHFLLALSLACIPLLGTCQPPTGNTAPPEVQLNVVSVEPPEKTAKDARAFRMNDTAQIPEDFWAHGAYGDIILQNDFVNFVFGAVPENEKEYNRVRQGNIIDIYTSTAAPENFQVFQPSILSVPDGRSAVATDIDFSIDEKAGSATVTVLSEDQVTSETSIDTTYELRKGWPGVLVTTTVTNNSKDEKTIPALADHVGWGIMGAFVSGNGWLSRQGTIGDNEFCFGRLFDSIVFIQPVSGLFEMRHYENFSLLVYEKDVKLKSGESKSYKRWLLAGQKDPSKLYGFVLQQRGPDKFGYIAGQIQERTPLADGKYIDSGVVPGGEVRIAVVRRADLPTQYLNKPYIYTFADQNGNYQLTVPEGEYLLTPFKSSRVYTPSHLATRAGKPNTVSAVDLLLSKPSTIVYEIVDAETGKNLPGKITFLPLRGTSEPDLGPPGALESSNTIISPTGKGVAEAPLGQFRLVASHGNEYHSQELRVKIEPLKSETVRFELKRAFKPEGWISADIGVLTSNSAHSRTSPKDRVIAAVAEDVKWIVTADPGTPTDLDPVIQELGFGDRIRASKGYHLTSNQEKHPGDFLLFPVDACSAGAGVDFAKAQEASTPAEAITALRALCPASVLVAHRPIFPLVGLLTLQGYDLASHSFPDTEMALDVDGFQVWEGKRQAVIAQSMEAYLYLASKGAEFVPVGYSMSQGTFNKETGYPRMYIQSSQADPKKLDVEELTRNIKQGKVLITNGPFLDMKVNGERPGAAVVTAKDNSVDIELDVYSPNWANVSAITLFLNGQLSRRIMLPPGSVDAEAGRVYPHPTSAKPEDEILKVSVYEDSILTVTVEGDPSLPQDPVNPLLGATRDETTARGQFSYAIAAPVFIDADGDGQVNAKVEAPKPPSAQTQETEPVPVF